MIYLTTHVSRGDPLGWFPYRVRVRIRVNGDVSQMVSAPASMIRVVAPRGRQHFKKIFAFRYYKRILEDFSQRRSYRAFTLIHVKMEIFHQRIRKLSANEIFWCFYFGSNFLIGWARRRGQALAQNWETKLLLERNFCLVTLETKPWFAEKYIFFFCENSFFSFLS